MNTFTLKVVQTKQETSDTITLCFKQPALKKIKYKAGQYLTLILRINGRRYIRPYSFSSAPGVDPLLEITVKRVQNGIVSNHICDVVKEGDVIEALEPMGDFIYEPNLSVDNIYLWGIGSGITPLISLAKYLLSTTSICIHLIYGNRNTESTIFYDQILELAEKHKGRFYTKHFFTKFVVDESNPDIILGRIDQLQALNLLNQNKEISESAHYICGPVGLKESVKSALKLKGILDNLIFSEDFELVKNPEDFEDIQTQYVQLQFESVLHNLEVIKGKSILEACLDASIELPYSCQTGNCNTCMGRLLSGEAKMIGLNKKRDDLNADEFLLCCTHPVTENVYIEI